VFDGLPLRRGWGEPTMSVIAHGLMRIKGEDIHYAAWLTPPASAKSLHKEVEVI
jgi:hypothetical protein